jgi:hypothetical protein
MFVPGNMGYWVVLNNRGTQCLQCLILNGLKCVALQTFKLYANRVVIAVVPAPIVGLTCVPSAVIATDELPNFAISADIKMCRNFQPLNTFEIGVLIPRQLVGEEGLHFITTILPGWQADGVQHNQVNVGG